MVQVFSLVDSDSGGANQGIPVYTDDSQAKLGEVYIVANLSPGIPTGLLASNQTSSSVRINWNASADPENNTPIVYELYKDGVRYPNTSTTYSATYVDVTSLTEGSTYSFTVVAVDSLGAKSSLSNPLVITTNAGLQARHIRWEFDNTQLASPDFIAVLELELNSPDILPSTEANWTASSQHASGEYNAVKAADGQTVTGAGTYWATNNLKTNQWLQCDLGNSQNVQSYRIWGVGPDRNQPKTCRVYTSNQATAPSKTYGSTSSGWTLAWSGTLPLLVADTPSQYFTLNG